MVPEIDEQQAVEQFEASVPLMQNEISEAEGTARFDTKRLETTWQWVARAQNLESDSLDPSQIVANGFVE
jgi:NitT/TauT family transport system substrate-binding protein